MHERFLLSHVDSNPTQHRCPNQTSNVITSILDYFTPHDLRQLPRQEVVCLVYVARFKVGVLQEDTGDRSSPFINCNHDLNQMF